MKSKTCLLCPNKIADISVYCKNCYLTYTIELECQECGKFYEITLSQKRLVCPSCWIVKKQNRVNLDSYNKYHSKIKPSLSDKKLDNMQKLC